MVCNEGWIVLCHIRMVNIPHVQTGVATSKIQILFSIKACITRCLLCVLVSHMDKLYDAKIEILPFCSIYVVTESRQSGFSTGNILYGMRQI